MKKPASDHALATIKAGLNLVPVVGGALSSLFGDYIPTHTQRSIERGLHLLREDLDALEGRLDADAINRDEFAELFKSCYLILVRTHQEEKIKAATALLANLLLKEDDRDKLKYDELDHFVRCVDGLSIGAVRVLASIAKLAVKNRKPSATPQSIRMQFHDIAKCHNYDEDFLMGLLEELRSYNLVHITQLGVTVTEMGRYGIYPVEFTTLGMRFVAFLN